MSLNKNSIMPSIYISHGGGPCFFMNGEFRDIWYKLENYLRNFNDSLKNKPKAIIIFSAHWEEDDFTINISKKPSLIYDYYGFPDDMYKIKYESSGSPKLASQIVKLLEVNNITVKVDSKRGWDHGVFVPLKVMYPNNDIPIVQISLKNNLDVKEHIKIGNILNVLRNNDILIIGSGSSYHNLKRFGTSGNKMSNDFDDWLSNTLKIEDKYLREKKLTDWNKEISAIFSHPREEHLIPLMVIEGTLNENEKITKSFSDEIMGIRLSCFQFG